MGFPAEFPDVFGVHGAVDREEELRIVATRMETLIDEEQIDAVEAQFPEMLNGIHDIAAQTGRIVDEDQIQRPGLYERGLDEALQAATPLDADAAPGLVRIDMIIEDDPVGMPGGFLAAVTDLICDRFGPLLVAAVSGVDSAARSHYSDSWLSRSSTMRSAIKSSHRSSESDASPSIVCCSSWLGRLL